MEEQSAIDTKYEKILKLNDYLENSSDNIIRIFENSNMQIGTGSRIWECVQIFQFVALLTIWLGNEEGNINLKGKICLELGCGTGMLAIVLACLGATVYCSDLSQLKEIVEENIKVNQELIKQNNGKIQFFELDWYSKEDKISKTIADKKFERIDLILGTDIIFNEKQLKIFPKILKLIYNEIKQIQIRTPQTYIAHKNRHDEIDDQLPKEFEFYEFFGEEIDPQEMDANYMSNRIAIFRFDL